MKRIPLTGRLPTLRRKEVSEVRRSIYSCTIVALAKKTFMSSLKIQGARTGGPNQLAGTKAKTSPYHKSGIPDRSSGGSSLTPRLAGSLMKQIDVTDEDGSSQVVALVADLRQLREDIDAMQKGNSAAAGSHLPRNYHAETVVKETRLVPELDTLRRMVSPMSVLHSWILKPPVLANIRTSVTSPTANKNIKLDLDGVLELQSELIATLKSSVAVSLPTRVDQKPEFRQVILRESAFLLWVVELGLVIRDLATSNPSHAPLSKCLDETEEFLLAAIPKVWSKHALHLPRCSTDSASVTRKNLLSTTFTPATPESTVFAVLIPGSIVGAVRILQHRLRAKGNESLGTSEKLFLDIVTSFVVLGCDTSQRKGLWKTLLLLDTFRLDEKERVENRIAPSSDGLIGRLSLDGGLKRCFGWHLLDEEGHTQSCRSLPPIISHPMYAALPLSRLLEVQPSSGLGGILISSVAAMWTISRFPSSLFAAGMTAQVVSAVQILTEAFTTVRGLQGKVREIQDVSGVKHRRQLITAFSALCHRFQDLSFNVSPDDEGLRRCARTLLCCFASIFNHDTPRASFQYLLTTPNEQRFVLNAVQNAMQIGAQAASPYSYDSKMLWTDSLIVSYSALGGVNSSVSRSPLPNSEVQLESMFYNLVLDEQQVGDIKMRLQASILSTAEFLASELRRTGQARTTAQHTACRCESLEDANEVLNREFPNWSLTEKFLSTISRVLLSDELKSRSRRDDNRIWSEARKTVLESVVEYTRFWRSSTMTGVLKLKSTITHPLPPPPPDQLRAILEVSFEALKWDDFEVLPQSSRAVTLELVAFCEELFLFVNERLLQDVGPKRNLLEYFKEANLRLVPGLQSLSTPFRMIRSGEPSLSALLEPSINDARRILGAALSKTSFQIGMEKLPSISNLLASVFSPKDGSVLSEQHPIAILSEMISTEMWTTEPPELLADLLSHAAEELWDLELEEQESLTMADYACKVLLLGWAANLLLRFYPDSPAFDYISQLYDRLVSTGLLKSSTTIRPWLAPFISVVKHQPEGRLRQKTLKRLAEAAESLVNLQVVEEHQTKPDLEGIAELALVFQESLLGSFCDGRASVSQMAELVGLQSGTNPSFTWSWLLEPGRPAQTSVDEMTSLKSEAALFSSPTGTRILEGLSLLEIFGAQLLHHSASSQKITHSRLLCRSFTLCLAEIMDALDQVDISECFSVSASNTLQVLADSSPLYLEGAVTNTLTLILSFVEDSISHTLEAMVSHPQDTSLLAEMMLELCGRVPRLSKRIPFIFDREKSEHWFSRAEEILENQPLELRKLKTWIDTGSALFLSAPNNYTIDDKGPIDYCQRLLVFKTTFITALDRSFDPSEVYVDLMCDRQALLAVMDSFGLFVLDYFGNTTRLVHGKDRGQQSTLRFVFHAIQVMGLGSRLISTYFHGQEENSNDPDIVDDVPTSWKEAQGILLEAVELIQGPPRFDRKAGAYTFAFTDVTPEEIVDTVESLENRWSVAVLGRVLIQAELIIKQSAANCWNEALANKLKQSMERCLKHCLPSESKRIAGLIEKVMAAVPQ